MERNSSSHKLAILPGTSGKNAIDKVEGKSFIVQPVFQPECQETIGTIFLRLMRAEVGPA